MRSRGCIFQNATISCIEEKFNVTHRPKCISHSYALPRNPIVVAHVIVLRKNVDVIFVDYHEHMVPKDVCNVSAPRPWSMLYGYIQWFYKVSHSYMTTDAK